MYLIATTGGAFLGGYISDKFEDEQPLTKSWVAAGSTTLALPLMVTCLTQQDNFWFSFAMMWLHYTFSEMWISPVTVMIQNTTS